jgi:hypothetical protein
MPVQRGCTNTGPIDAGPADFILPEGAEPIDGFDVVFDRNGDGCYMPGTDLLDIVGGDITRGGLVSYDELMALRPADRVGFRVVR